MSNKYSIKALLIEQGWNEDRFGNLKSVSGKVRVKLQELSMRVERKISYEECYGYKRPDEWLNVCSDYYKNVKIVENKVVIRGKSIKSQLQPA